MTYRFHALLFALLCSFASLAAADASELAQAIREGAPAAQIEAMLRHGADFDQPDDQGHTPLMDAVFAGREDVAKLLLKKGARVNAVSRNGYTPLMVAAMGGHPAMVKQMVAQGAQLEAQDASGRSALVWATLFTLPAFASAQSGGATAADRLDVLKMLLEHGADANIKLSQGVTPLMLAAASGSPEVLALLIKHGAAVNAAGKQDGLTPLMLAAQNGNTDNVRELLKHGARPRMKSAEGKTALDYAVGNGHRGAATLLSH